MARISKIPARPDPLNPLGIGVPAKKRRKTKPRPAPRPIDDLTWLPAGPRVVVPWPAVELGPNFSGNKFRSIVARKKYRVLCHHLALEAGWHRLMHRARAVAAEHGLVVRIDFFPPPNVHTYDHDNVEAAFKSGRDGLSIALGLDDRHFRTDYHHHPDRRSCLVVTLVSLQEPGA